jgi:Uma2 family endonuclease
VVPEVGMTTLEFARRPDRREYELLDGRPVTRTVSVRSAIVAGEVFGALAEYARPCGAWAFPGGLGYACFPNRPDHVRRPSASYVRAGRLTDGPELRVEFAPVAPDLVVEVISPDDRAGGVNQKVQEWLEAGVRLVWLIDPEARTVFAYHRDRPATADIVREADTLTGDPVLPGFAVPAADLFRFPAGSPTTP